MEPECNFWGLKIPAGKSVRVAPDYKEDFITSVHLTQVALGDKPAAGGHTIFIEKAGQKYALGTLESNKCPHFSLDIHLATDSIQLSHTGKSPVYLTGYEAVSIAGDDEDEFPMGAMQGSEDDSGEDESESDEEDVPPGVPINNKQNGRMVLMDDEAEEGESEEKGEGDSDGDDSDEDGLRGSQEDSDSQDEDEEEEDDDSEGDSDDDDEEEAESSEEEAALPVKGKRAAAKAPAATPQPKRNKEAAGTGAQAPATAPPKVAAAVPSSSSDYLAALKAHLSSGGPTKLAVLGSAVKRPPKVPKLKHFLEQHRSTFKYDAGNDTVSLLR